MRTAVVFVALCLCLVPLVGAVTASDQTEVSGVSIELTAQNEQELLDRQSNWTTQLGVDARTNAFMLDTGDRVYYVFTDGEPDTAQATVEGLSLPISATHSVLFADSVEYGYDARSVGLDALRDGIDGGELVQTTATYRQFPFALDQSGAVAPLTGGYLGGEAIRLTQIGRLTRHTLFNAANGSLPMPAAMEQPDGSATVIGYGDTRWLVNERATVTVARGGITTDENRISRVEFSASEIGGPAAIDSGHVGEVVQFTANGTGGAISAQETLQKVAPCPKTDMVANPWTGCFPLATDMTIHAGVLWSGVPDERSDVVTYAGVSNDVQQTPVAAESGEWQITGRVVATSQIDPRLPDGYAVLVYDRERVGPVGPVAEAESFATDVQDRLRSQLVASASEWRDEANGELLSVDRTMLDRAATPTPTATTTVSPTATATPRPTESEGGVGSSSGDNNDGQQDPENDGSGEGSVTTPTPVPDGSQFGGTTLRAALPESVGVGVLVTGILTLIFTLSSGILTAAVLVGSIRGGQVPVSDRGYYGVLTAALVSILALSGVLWPVFTYQLVWLLAGVAGLLVFLYGLVTLVRKFLLS